ncbi:MAG: DMT family transporter [Bacillota bacterium]
MERFKGYIAVMISAVVFGSMPLMAKTIYQEGGNPVTLTFLRFFLVLPILFFFVSRNKNGGLMLTRDEAKKLLLVGTLGYGATTLTLYMSYNYISSGIATTLHFAYPVLVILTYVVLFNAKASGTKLLAVSLTIVGILFLNESDADINLVGFLLAFGSAVAYAFYVTYLDRSGLKSMHPLKLTLYLCISASSMVFLFGILTGTLNFRMSLLGWGVSVFLSILVAFLGVSLFQIGVSLIGPQKTSILSTFEPVTSIIIGALLFNEVISGRTIAGFVSIVAAVVLITAFDRG